MADQGIIGVVLAIVAISAMCVVALDKGIDGQIVYVAIAAVAGLAGYEVREKLGKRNGS